MPPLLQSAQLKPDVTITSAESDDDIESDDDRSVIHSLEMFFIYLIRACVPNPESWQTIAT